MIVMARSLLKCILIIVLSIFSLYGFSKGKTIEIKGYVTDKQGVPIEGAGIFSHEEKGKDTGCLSDSTGFFKFSCACENGGFYVKMLGYQTRYVRIDNRPQYYIILYESMQSVDDVVVTGYVDRKKDSYTGSIYAIKRETIDKLVHTNALEIIRLSSPGFEITKDILQGSNPNKVPEMILRGRSSFVEGDKTNVPLFILDGSEVDINYVFNMPTEDIESIYILKDAPAASFYGSKAANGVIVITTRSTKEGRLQVSYSGNMQITSPDLSDYHLLNAADKLEYERLAGLYGNFKGSSSSDVSKQILYYEKKDRVNAGVNTDWKRLALRTGISHIHNITLSGGSRMFRYNLSGSYNGISGVMDKSGKGGSSLRINLTYGDMRKIFLQNITSFGKNFSTDVPYGSFSDYVKLNPYDKPYNDDGTLNNNLSFIAANPLYEKNLNSYIKNSSYSFINTFRLRWSFFENMRIEATMSFSRTESEAETFYSPHSKKFYFADPLKRGSFDIFYGNTETVSSNIFFVYDKTWIKNTFILTSGANIESRTNNSNSFRAIGVLSDKLDHPSMASGFAESSHPGGGRNVTRMLGGYINANYIFDNRYFADFSIRYEGSSLFGADNKFAPFGAIGLGWNIHREEFMKGKNVSLLKLRASIGYVGNAGFSPYQARLAYRYNVDLQYDGNVGAVPVSMVNPRLKWEKSLKRNLGLDFVAFNDRLSGSLEVYYNTTNDIVMTIAKPSHIGFKDSKENLGRIRNCGIEMSLRGNIFRTSDSNLNVFWNVSHNDNKIMEISNYLKNRNKKNEETSKPSLPNSLYEEGQSMTTLKVMQSAGINPANGKELFVLPDGNLTYKYDYHNKKAVGDIVPTLQGVFGFNYSFKNIEISTLFAYRLGATIFNQTLAMKVEGADPTCNVDKRVFNDRWKRPGDIAKYKSITSREITPATTRFTSKEYALEGSSLQISYSIPQKFCKKLHIRHLRLSASTGDLFHISTIRRERGLDYPFARVYLFSLNLNI
jgi:hypothetical protein